MYWLVGVEGNDRRVRLPVRAPLLVGRGASNHVILEDPAISRQHACFAPERGAIVLYDLNSANGTRVNEQCTSRHRVRPGDVIRFGSCSFRVEAANDAALDEEPNVQQPELTELADAYQKLGTLYSFMKTIGQPIERSELLDFIGRKVRDVYPRAHAVAILLRDETGGFRRVYASGEETTTILPADVRHGALTTSSIAGPGSDFHGAPESTRALGGTDMFAPILDGGEVCGVIHVSVDPSRAPFSPNDLELLKGMAAAAATMLQTARTRESSARQERLESDLDLAAKIQESFLPRKVMSVEGLELFAEYHAAYRVGGDFYDVLEVGEDKLAVFIGDISGHGIAAALRMARISSELRVAARVHVEPALVLSAMNKALLATDQPELFFTAVYFTFDVKTGEVVLANAGHPPPYVRRATGALEPLTEGASCAVGVLQEPAYASTKLRLGQGDSLVLYTDGVIEAADAHGRLYGASRLEACLGANTTTRASDLARQILRSVEEHASSAAATDDLTVFVCHRAVAKTESPQPRRASGAFARPRATELERRP